ncbi:MAG: transposase [Treponema sp.]|nr:transposase [Treponema sp.]
MSRKPRLYCESQIYHVILRGNNKQEIFYDDRDRYFFIRKLEFYVKEMGIAVFSYCLMDNHVHILIGNANLTMSKLIQKLATSYAMYFNRKYGRCGHLFQGRYKSEPVENDRYFKTVARYILQNPLKVNNIELHEYKWSSYTQTVKENCNRFIDRKRLFEIFDGKKQFLDFVHRKNTDVCMEYENRFIFNDYFCMKYIKKLFGLEETYELISIPVDQKLQKIKVLKSKGIPISQLSRLTGVTRQVIERS